MKKLLLNSLAALALVAGANTAVAQDTADGKLENVVAICKAAADDAWYGQVNGDYAHINNGSGTAWVGIGYFQFSLDGVVPEGMGVAKATFGFYATGEGRRARATSVYTVNAGETLDVAAFEAPTGIINLAATALAPVSSVDFPQSANGTADEPTLFELDCTINYNAIAATQNYIIFKVTGNAGGGDVWNTEGHKPYLKLDLVGAEMITTYTVEFLPQRGNNPLKDSKTYPGVVGNTYTPTADDLAPFFNDDQTKYYVSLSSNDNVSLTLGQNPAENVMKLKFRDGKKYTWTVNMVNAEGTAISAPNTGEAWEGIAGTMGDFKKYILFENVFYQVDPEQGPRTQNDQFQVSLGALADNVTKDIFYSPCTDEALTNVVFCQEGEDIWPMVANRGGNAPVRASNACIGNSENTVEVTTLNAGTYKIVAGLFNAKNFGAKFTNKAGDVLFDHTCANVNLNQVTSEEFTIAGDDALYVTTAEDHRAGNGIDFIILQKTSGAPFVGSVENVAVDVEDANAPVYNVFGQRVAPDYKGIVIKGGKKYYNF